MQAFSFTKPEQATEFFSFPPEIAVDRLVTAIVEALKVRKEDAMLYELQFTFDEGENYEVSLPEKEWEKALTYSLHYYAELGRTEKALDVYEFLEVFRKAKEE